MLFFLGLLFINKKKKHKLKKTEVYDIYYRKVKMLRCVTLL